jgi:hypothetical protein
LDEPEFAGLASRWASSSTLSIPAFISTLRAIELVSLETDITTFIKEEKTTAGHNAWPSHMPASWRLF